jgi:hypothetical protein
MLTRWFEPLWQVLSKLGGDDPGALAETGAAGGEHPAPSERARVSVVFDAWVTGHSARCEAADLVVVPAAWNRRGELLALLLTTLGRECARRGCAAEVALLVSGRDAPLRAVATHWISRTPAFVTLRVEFGDDHAD